jgi:hypothetical protein
LRRTKRGLIRRGRRRGSRVVGTIPACNYPRAKGAYTGQASQAAASLVAGPSFPRLRGFPMLSSLEGILIAILMALPLDDDRDRNSRSGTARDSAPEELHTDVSACQRFSDGMMRQNCVVRVARREGKDIEPGAVFPRRLSWVAPIDPAMPGRLRLMRNMPQSCGSIVVCGVSPRM